MTQANTRAGTMHSVTHQDLMAGPPPTHLPASTRRRPTSTPGMPPGDVVRRHPASPAAWLAARHAGRSEQRPTR